MNGLNKGFSLIEISIVIIIISVILSLAIPIGSAQVETENVKTTRTRLNTVAAAIATYVGTNNSLPCPARINPAHNTANFGAATDCTVAAVAGVTNITSGGNNIRIGSVPVKALGLSETYAHDAWGRRLTYVVDKALTTGVGTMATAGHINITDANNNALTAPAATGAYFMFSSGKEGKGGYGYNGNNPVTLCGTTAKDSENCNGDFQFIDTAYNDGTIPANFFDDLVMWRTNTLGGSVISSVLPACANNEVIASNGSGGFQCIAAAKNLAGVLVASFTGGSCYSSSTVTLSSYPTATWVTLTGYAQADQWKWAQLYLQFYDASNTAIMGFTPLLAQNGINEPSSYIGTNGAISTPIPTNATKISVSFGGNSALSCGYTLSLYK